MVTSSKKLFAMALSFAGVLCVAPVVSADYDNWRGAGRDYDNQQDDLGMSTRDQRSFERYLKSHWRIAQQLYQNPDLIHDQQFVRNHESLDNWLDNHPDAAEAIQANPHKYLWSDRANQMSDDQKTAYMSERDLRSFENFLDSHSETAQSLYENPELINDRHFTRNHAALNDWLDNHPQAADAIQANPHKFLWRERSVSAADFLRQLFR